MDTPTQVETATFTKKRKKRKIKNRGDVKKTTPIYSKPPMTAKCAICLEIKPWRTGVVCSHTEASYKDHWVCPSCFLTHAQSQLTFPFKCVHPQCILEYSDYEIYHLNLPSSLQSKWVTNSLKEVK